MLPEATIDRIAAYLQDREIDEQTVQALRHAFVDLHFTYCSNDDVYGGLPIRRGRTFNMYLISSGATCLSLTTDPAAATGLVIAHLAADHD